MVSAVLVAALLLSEGRSVANRVTSDAPVAPPSTYIFAQTQRVDVGGGTTRVSAETNIPTPNRGYFPLRVFIDNTTGPRQTVKISFHPSNAASRPISKSVEVREGERRTVVLPVPYLFRYGKLKVRGPGITQQGEQHIYFNNTYAPTRPVLSLGSTTELERWMGQAPAHSNGDLNVLAMPPEDAPTELAAYTGYDTVVIPAAQFETLSEGQRRALESYAATGGTLVLGKGGRGLVTALPLLGGEAREDQDYGLGRLVVCEGSCSPNLGSYFDAPEPQLELATPGQGNSSRRRSGGSSVDLTALLPQATAPIGRFLFIIGLFTLAIGPGSIWVARRRGPAALLLTIPSTAFVTCAAIIGFSLIQDGFTVHASTQGLTLLDSRQHRALQVGLTAYYANLAPGAARFSSLVSVMPPGEGSSSEPYGPSIEWGESAALGSDFVPSRTYREWGYVSAEPTRARVVIKRKAGGWVVQNALGSTVSTIVFMADDAVWMAREVREGAEGTAEKTKTLLPELDERVHTRFSDRLLAQFKRPLKEGEFLATIDGQGFTPSGGLRLDHHDSEHLVRGEVEQ